MNLKFNKAYWDNKYRKNDIGWDIGYPSNPLTHYFNQLSNKELKILIPGGGNCYEGEYLVEQGFKNVYVIDIASKPLLNIQKRYPKFPITHLIQDDFFNHIGSYDLIIEQTFFCALDPVLREKYVSKMHNLLSKNGKLVGLFFDFELTNEGPPFGGNLKEYHQLFSTQFNIKTLDKSYNSIKPRFDRELFFIFEKK